MPKLVSSFLLPLLVIVLVWTNDVGHEQQHHHQQQSTTMTMMVEAFVIMPSSSSRPKRLLSPTTAKTTTAGTIKFNNNKLSIDVNNHHMKSTSLYVTTTPTNGSGGKDPLTFGGREPSLEDYIVILLPAVLTIMAFIFYEQTSQSFHNLVDYASSNTWVAVDGGAYLSDLLIPALNGPVVTFISLLFGSLSSMTLSNLYNRQVMLANKFAKFVEDLRLLDLHLSYLPSEYQYESKASLRRYATEMKQTFNVEISASEMQSRREWRREEIEYLVSILHQVSMIEDNTEVSGRVLDEAYGTLNRIIDRRSDMAAVYDQQFPVWHYGNLALLATAICTVFFILTDRSALMFLGAFQLRTCWAILVGTISVLFCVIYDLNTPLQGVFQIVKQPDRIFLREFAREAPESYMKEKETLFKIQTQPQPVQEKK